MKQLFLAAIAILSLLALAVVGFVPLTSEKTVLGCEAPTRGIGTCAQLVRKETLAGTRVQARIRLTPTNTGRLESEARFVDVEVGPACIKGGAVAEWATDGLRITPMGGGASCVIDRQRIGQW